MENKPKRKLKNISFEQDGAHIALCSKEQGVANKADYALVLRSKMFSEEFVQKLQQVKVTLELPEFLRRFFDIYYEDAEVLARLMGYVEPKEETEETDEDYWENYIQTKLQAFEIIKSAHEGDYTQVLANLEEEQYLSILQDQEKLEKAIAKYDLKKQEELAKAEAERKKPRIKKSTASKSAEVKPQIVDEVNKGGVITPVVKQNKEQSMTQSTTVEQTVEVEMVAKAELDVIQKAFKEQQEQLEKALASVAKFEQERKEQIAKSRKDQLQAACGEHAEVLFKAVGEVEEGVFADVVKALSAMKEQVEKSKLFEEVGANVEPEEPADNATAAVKKALLAKLNQQTK